MPMKDGHAPIIVTGSASRFLEKGMKSNRARPGIAIPGYASPEIPGKVKLTIAIGSWFIFMQMML
jgi:hypothetical protein